MDLKTSYLGLELRTPFVASASPLSEDISKIIKMEEAGISAVVLHSLFEEQIRIEQMQLDHFTSVGDYISPEAQKFFPEPDEYRLGPEEYLNHIRKAKQAVKIPIIGSINGVSQGGWIKYAKLIQEAGADALELNIYYIPTVLNTSADFIENLYIDIIKSVKNEITIPLAVKLSPYFTNMANMASRISEAGASALVLFNRFLQPDIDLDELEVSPYATLSHPGDTRLSLRWIAILKNKIKCDFAATGGIHTTEDAIKLLLVGANVTMLASAMLKNGINHVRSLETELNYWLEKKEYKSLNQMQGTMHQNNLQNTDAFERSQYMRALTHYKI